MNKRAVDQLTIYRRFWGVFWVNTSNLKTIDSSFQEIIDNCEVKKSTKSLPRWLSSIEEPFLLIFDNADNPQLDVSKYFPPGNRGTILITSRNPACSVHAQPSVNSHRLYEMDAGEAVELLFKAANMREPNSEDKQEAGKMISTLGGIALAIVQAGAVIRSGLSSLWTYCEEFKRQKERLLQHKLVGGSSGYDQTVWTTLEISLDKIHSMGGEAVLALDLLDIISFWHFDSISEKLFAIAWKHNRLKNSYERYSDLSCLIDCKTDIWDSTSFRQARQTLASFSLISVDARTQHISMHPLVHVWARNRIETNLRANIYKAAASIIALSGNDNTVAPDFKHQAACMPHLISCFRDFDTMSQTIDNGDKEIIMIASDASQACLVNGQFLLSSKLASRGLAISKDCRELAPQVTCTLMCTLSSCHSDLGENEKALSFARAACELSESFQSSENLALHLGTTTVYANALSKAGDTDKALQLQNGVISRLQDMHNPEGFFVRRARGDLASIYLEAKNYTEVKSIAQDLLRKEDTHSYIYQVHRIDWSSLLARAHGKLRNFHEALEVQFECVSIAQNIFGLVHFSLDLVIASGVYMYPSFVCKFLHGFP